MTIPLHKTVVNLHAGLSQDGINRATNENEYNDITPIWFDLTRSGRYGQLKGYEKHLDGGWLGDNSLTNPFALNISRPENSIEIMGTSNFPNSSTNHMAMDMWVKFAESGKVVTKGEVGTAGFDVIYDRDGFSLEINAATLTKKAQVVAQGIYPEQWYHFTVNVDDTRLWVIINGETIITRNLVAQASKTNGSNYVIGGGFVGSINALRIYNTSLDWLDIEHLFHAGLLIKYDSHDLRGRGNIPSRSELYGLLKVEPATRMKANYVVMGNYEHDMESKLSVTVFDDLVGTMNVPNIVSVRVNYIILADTEEFLPSTITVNQLDSLKGTVQINHSIRAVAKYGQVTQEDVNQSFLKSNIRVNKEVTIDFTKVYARASYDIPTGRDLPSTITTILHSNLEGSLTIDPKGRLVAKYGIEGMHVRDLPSELDVPNRSEIKGNITVLLVGNVTARYRIHTIEVFDLPSSINVNATSQIKSAIVVPLQGKARALYGISPIVYHWLDSNIAVSEFSELFGTIMVNYRSRAVAKYDVTPIYFEWLESELTVREIADLKGILFISKEFGATARYTVAERPKYTILAYPNKDAYVREFFPRINYGNVNQLYAGNIGSPFPEKYKTYIAFDLTRLPTDNIEVGEAKLKIYYDGRNGNQRLKITPVTQQWQESSITWSNRPDSLEGDESLTYYVDIPEKSSYMEIDVRNIVNKWATQELFNCGFLIEQENTSDRKLTGFYSKESTELRPELHIMYYDLKIYSDDRVWLDGTITVRNYVNKDLRCSINIRNRWLRSDLTSSIKVKYPYDLEGDAVVSNPNLNCSIDIRNSDNAELESSVDIRVEGTSDLESFIFANEKEKPSYVYVLYRGDLDSDITARRTESVELEGTISVSETNKSSHINVPFYEGIESDITVSQFENSELECTIDLSGNRLLRGSIAVRRTESTSLDSNVTVRSYEDLEAYLFVNQPALWCEVAVRKYDDYEIEGNISVVPYADLESVIQVYNPSLNGHISVFNTSDLGSRVVVRLDGLLDKNSNLGVKPTHDMVGELFVNDGRYLIGSIAVRRSRYDLLRGSMYVRPYDDLEGSMIVANPNLKSYISTIQFELLKGTLTVRNNGKEDLGSELYVPFRYDLPITAKIRTFSQITGRVIVISGNLFSNIKVPAYGRKDLRGNISARVRMVSDLPINMLVASGLLGSSISVRHSDYRDLEANLSIRNATYANLESSIGVPKVDDLEGSVAINKGRWINLPSYIAVRLSEIINLESDISVRVWGDPDKDGGQLEGHIAVRRDATYDKKSEIAVRRDDLSELVGTISAKEISQLEGTISARRDDFSLLPSSISARQSDKSELEGSISAKQINELESTIAVRQSDWSDLRNTISVFQVHEMESAIAIRRDDFSDLPLTMAIRNDSQQDVGGTVSVFQLYLVESTIEIRRSDSSDLMSDIAVRKDGFNELDSSITARQSDIKDLRGNIRARRSDRTDLPSHISAMQKHDLECSIEVMTAYPYAFIM